MGARSGQAEQGRPDGHVLAFSFGKGEDVGWLVVLDDLILTWLNLEDSK